MRDLDRDHLVVSRFPYPQKSKSSSVRRPAVEGLEGRVLMAATVYEAESAVLTGATVSRSPGGFSGAGYVDYRNPSGDTVEWAVEVPADGAYALGVRYANGSSGGRPLQLSIDGAAAADAVTFPGTGDWAVWGSVTRTVTLSAGPHVVRLTAIGWSGPNVDALTLEPTDALPPPPPATQTIEAEDGKFVGPRTSASNSGYSGSGYVDFVHNADDYVEWSVDAAAAGPAELEFRYASGSSGDRPLELRVNGQVVHAAMSFAPTGSWTKWLTVKATVPLAAGANTVRLTSVGRNGPNLDAFSLAVAPAPTPEEPDEVLSLRVYHIGNSLTNGINYGSLDKMAAGDGRDYVFGRHVISGAPMSRIWDHPDSGIRSSPFDLYPISLPKEQWDALTLEPFERQLYQADGSGDVQVAQKFINLALARSPKLTTYIYQRWPRRTQNADGSYSYDYEKLWLRTYTGKWDLTNETRDYFNQVVGELRKAYPNSPEMIRMVPVGDVMFELNRRIVAGKVPGVDSIQRLFADGIHLTNWGAFLIGTTFYATMYERDPRGLDFKTYDVLDDPWDSKIDPGYAKVVQEIVWDVLRANPYTGL
jgi:hypothetical protein